MKDQSKKGETFEKSSFTKETNFTSENSCSSPRGAN